MGKHQHVSRMAMPESWPLPRKGTKWIAKPDPGTHSLETSMPVIVYLRDILQVVQVARIAKKILNAGEILINGKTVRDLNFPVGVFDTLAIPKTGKFYRVVLDSNGKLRLLEIPQAEAKLTPVKIVGKKTMKKGKLEINLSNGWNMLAGKESYKIDDVLLIDTAQKKPVKHFKLEEGCTVYVIGGQHVGKVATFKGVRQAGISRKEKLAIIESGKEKWETSLDKVFPIGFGKPEIKVE